MDTDAYKKRSSVDEEDPKCAREWMLELKKVSKRLLTNKIWLLNLVRRSFCKQVAVTD